MERTISNETPKKVGEKVMLKGWLHTLRLLGSINFLILRDRGGLMQIIIQDKEELKKVKDLQPGSVLTIEGEVQESKQTEIGAEIINPKITVEVEVKDVPPVEYTKEDINAEIDTLLDYRSVTLRNLKQQAIFKVQAGILEAFADSMRKHEFTEYRSPVLQGVPSESGASVFEVGYYDNKAYLAQSPQIYKQIMVGIFERVFTIATVFRAEKHNTSRHLSEITQMDGEMAFIENYEEVLDMVENVVRDILEHLEKNYQKELKMWDVTLPKLPEGKFPRVKVKEALKIVEERIKKSAERDELDVDPEDEREISKWALEKHNSDFVWLLNFKKDKNFYTWNNPEDPEESLSYDLECRGLEWLSGTHRIHKHEYLLERLEQQGLKKEHYEHYLQAFKYGMPSEAGFSLGLERMTKQIFELSNIREATLFPSDMKRVAGMSIKTQTVNGGENMIEAIKSKLKKENIEFEHLVHEPTPTSEDAAKVRNTKMEEGIKAIILKGKKSGNNFMACVPAHLKLDIKSLSRLAGEALTFEDPEKIKEKFGLIIGGVPPFGNLLDIPTYYDQKILDEERAVFNAGLQTESIIMESADLIKAVEPLMGEFAK